MSTETLIEIGLSEDLPQGDATTNALGVKQKFGYGRLVAKQDLTLSGCLVFEEIFKRLDPTAQLKWHFDDGKSVYKNQNVCTFSGNLISLLTAERISLNFLMHLSGIATLTSQFVKKIQKYDTKILDTRKTLPGYRHLEKKAVRDGGGFNHRMNLSEAILIKDNHIALMGGISKAVNQTRMSCSLPIEVEASTLDQVQQCVDLQVQRILLDNMNNQLLEKALALIPENIETEASGNMSLDRIESVAALGVNFISVGVLTHSAPAADLSLLFDWD